MGFLMQNSKCKIQNECEPFCLEIVLLNIKFFN